MFLTCFYLKCILIVMKYLIYIYCWFKTYCCYVKNETYKKWPSPWLVNILVAAILKLNWKPLIYWMYMSTLHPRPPAPNTHSDYSLYIHKLSQTNYYIDQICCQRFHKELNHRCLTQNHNKTYSAACIL